MKLLIEDLRFFIGAFFIIVGFILTIEGIRTGVLVEGYNLNLITGIIFLIFGLGAFVMSVRACKKT